MLVLTKIQKQYGKNAVLREINLQAANGSCVGILGGNGGGKTTLLSILGGILRPDGGSFTYDGEELFGHEARRRALVGFSPQANPLMEELSGFDNLLLWHDRKAIERGMAEDGAITALGVTAFLKKPVAKLSGGMKKRLALSIAVLRAPKILLLDEPTAALDMEGKAKFYAYLKRFTEGGGTALFVTHDFAEFAHCDQLVFLKDGILRDIPHPENQAAAEALFL